LANAYYNARDYAKDRIQGRLMTNPKAGRTAIINHEDIKRTLLMGKAHVEVMRAMLYKTFFMFDIRHHDPDPEKRAKANDLIEVTTPLCKAYPSDEAWSLIGEAIQVYGGYGYCEEYPVAQIARDVKIYSIWEGTNFIQSMDLVGRKWTMKKGAAFAAFIAEMKDFCAANKENTDFAKEFANLESALSAYGKLQKAMGGYFADKKFSMMPLFARRILTATSQLYGGYLILDQALLADRKAKELGPEHYDYSFYTGKIAAARYYLMNVVPNVEITAKIIADGDESALDIAVESFEY
ncbi:MAG: acyl-CoA dehydrogenase, partial [Anaerolineaceae bacterium]